MVIVWGWRRMGQADRVEKAFWVATNFLCIMWAPVLPTGGYLVLDGKLAKTWRSKLKELTNRTEHAEGELVRDEKTGAFDDGEDVCIPIGMRLQSVVLGYLRGWGLWLGVCLGVLGGLTAAIDGFDAGNTLLLAIAGGGLVVAIASYYGPWNTASPRRAAATCAEAGLDIGVLPKEMQKEILRSNP